MTLDRRSSWLLFFLFWNMKRNSAVESFFP